MINRLGEFFPEKSGRGQPVVWHTMLCPFKQDWPKNWPKIGHKLAKKIGPEQGQGSKKLRGAARDFF